MKRLLSLALLLACAPSFAGIQPSGYGLAYGVGNPNNLRGGRASLQWLWDWHAGKTWQLGGYWDASYAYWHTNGNMQDRNKYLSAFAFAPVFRLSYNGWTSAHPYLEGSIGAAYLTRTKLGRRSFSTHWQFQDLVGLGVTFGEKHNYDLSVHYLHYSNAEIKKPNDGIDVIPLITFKYSLGYLP